MATTAEAVPDTEPAARNSISGATIAAPLPWTICSVTLEDDEYQIVMRYVSGASVGIGMTDPVGGKGAVVKGDLQPNGQVAAWNKTCAEHERVKEGDSLIGVGTRPDALTYVSGRSYKEVIEQVRKQIKAWERDGVLIFRFRRARVKPESPFPTEKGDVAGDKKDSMAKENKESESKDSHTPSSSKKAPLLHTKRADGNDPVWVTDAATKIDQATSKINRTLEAATTAASAKLKKDWERLKKDEKGQPILKPEAPIVRDPDAEIYLTDGQQQYLHVLGLITSNSAKLAKLLQFVSKTQKQDVLFVCEVEQLLAAQSQLTPVAIAAQTKKIMRVFLELGEEIDHNSEQPAPAEEANVPCTVMNRLRPKVSSRLRELYAQMCADPDMEELKASDLVEALETAKEDTRRMLCRDVLGNFADYLSGKTYNKDVESAEAFPFDFDDILVDARLYRAFLLFLMDAQRYQMLLFWKACYDVSLDTFVTSDVKDPAVLRTLQDLYRKYIRGVSAPPSMQHSFPATYREQNITNDPALPSALQATCKKIDRELRFDIWSMFLASPHYITLMGRQQGKGKPKSFNARNLMAFLKQQPVTQEMIVVPCTKSPPSVDPYMIAVVHKTAKSAPQTPTTSPPPSPPPSPKQGQNLSPANSVASASISPRPPPALPSAAPVVELRPHRIFEYVIVLSAYDRPEHSSRLCNVKLLRRHPRGDHVDFPMPNAKPIAKFCFPFNEDVSGVCSCHINPHFDTPHTSGLDAWGCPTSAAPRPQLEKRLFTFVSGDSSTGNKVYGAYLLIRGPPTERKAGEEQEENHRPSNSLMAVCVMSRIPLVQVLRDALWSLSIHTDYTEWLTNPFELSLAPFLRMSSASLLKEGAISQTPCSDVPLKILLRHLHPNRVIMLLGALLLEKQILLVSSDIAILALICECAVSSLLLPFIWNYPTIPVLPISMLSLIDCPTPFLLGIHTCYLPLAKAKAVGRDTVIVNLDEDEIAAVSDLPHMPAACTARLTKTLKSLYFEDGLGFSAPSVWPAGMTDPDLEFHRDLISMWAFLLAGWKDFCLYLPDQTDPSIIFDCPNFLNSRYQLLSATDSCFALTKMENKQIEELVGFLGMFVRSGFFPLFIQQRTAFITHANDAKSGDFDEMEKFLKDGLDGIKTQMPVPVYTRPSFKMLSEALVLDPSPSFFEDDNDKTAKQSSLDIDDDVVVFKKPPPPSVAHHTAVTISTTNTSNTHGQQHRRPSVDTSFVTTPHAINMLDTGRGISKEKSKFRSLFDTKSKRVLTPASTLAPEKLAALATVTQTVQLTSSTSSAKQMFKKTFGTLPSGWNLNSSTHYKSSHGGSSTKHSSATSAENSRSSLPSRRSRNSRDFVDESSRNAEVGTDTATAAYANRVLETSVNSEDSERNPYEDSVNASTWGSQASTNTRMAFSPEIFIDPSFSAPNPESSSPPTPSNANSIPRSPSLQSEKSESEGNGGRLSARSSLSNNRSFGNGNTSPSPPSANGNDHNEQKNLASESFGSVPLQELTNPSLSALSPSSFHADLLAPEASAFSSTQDDRAVDQSFSESTKVPESSIQPGNSSNSELLSNTSLEGLAPTAEASNEQDESRTETTAPLSRLSSSGSEVNRPGHVRFADTVNILQIQQQQPVQRDSSAEELQVEPAASDVVVHLRPEDQSAA